MPGYLLGDVRDTVVTKTTLGLVLTEPTISSGYLKVLKNDQNQNGETETEGLAGIREYQILGGCVETHGMCR